jgi:hypothetical protein
MAATGWNISKLNTRPRLDCCTLFLYFCVLCTVCIQEEGSPTQHLYKGSELFSKVFMVLNNSENIKNGQFFKKLFGGPFSSRNICEASYAVEEFLQHVRFML